MQESALASAIVSHRLQIDVNQRLKQFQRIGTLYGDHRPDGGHVVKDNLFTRRGGDFFRQMRFNPFDDFVVVAGVDDEHVIRLTEIVEIISQQNVVQNKPLFVGYERIANLPQRHIANAAGKRRRQKLCRPGTFKTKTPHVRNVYQTAGGADSVVFRDNCTKLNRHVPAGEIDHLRAEANVVLIKGCSHGISLKKTDC